VTTTNQIRLIWQDNSNNEFGFTIERSLNGATWTPIASVGPNVTTYTNIGLACNTTYFYRVRANNLGGNSGYSNTANATPNCLIVFKLYLPIIMRNFAPPPPPPPGSKPVDGHWTGSTSRSQPMSFDVSSGGTAWSNLTLRTTASVGGCTATVEVTVSPGTIVNNQFSGGGGNFSFTGQFNSPTTASGTYSFVNHPGCGGFSQSGTWTANAP
jgi:hypothetical protein